ncbi:MAG TPA: hypothetical protein VLT57_08010 [Bryobacteraceae bacterium]|nr:hypothetical protein [Bryobacteraceae bacterium]
MKAIRCIIWLLGAFLLFASLDNVPDPPATNPGTVQIEASCPHQYAVPAAGPSDEFAVVVSLVPAPFAAADAGEPAPPNTQSTFTEQSSDPSPPYGRA